MMRPPARSTESQQGVTPSAAPQIPPPQSYYDNHSFLLESAVNTQKVIGGLEAKIDLLITQLPQAEKRLSDGLSKAEESLGNTLSGIRSDLTKVQRWIWMGIGGGAVFMVMSGVLWWSLKDRVENALFIKPQQQTEQPQIPQKK